MDEKENVLKIDLGKYIPQIIDIYIKIFGKQNKEIIKKRLKDVFYAPYYTLEGIKNYLHVWSNL